MEDTVDKYGKNFTIRFTNDEKDKLVRRAKKDKMRRSTLIRRALELYYESKKEEDEIETIKGTPFKNLPLLITIITTEGGKNLLQERLIQGE